MPEQCERHGVAYSALAPCAQCRKDPGPAVTGGHAFDELERELRIRQDEFRADGKFLRKHARDLISGVDAKAIDRRDAYKAYECAFKAERLALEALKEIRDKEHDRWLAAEVARQQGREVAS